MPIFSTKPAAPQIPPGFYVAQARGVSQVHKTTKSGEECSVFVLPLFLPDGKKITTNVYLLPQTTPIVRGLCKSGNIIIPPGDGEAIINTDDLERRKFYIQVVEVELPDGRKVNNVKFNSPSWIISKAPELAGLTFPNEAPPITLRVLPETPPEEPGPGATAPTPPPSPSAPSVENDGISEAEMLEAIEIARSIRAKKQGQAQA